MSENKKTNHNNINSDARGRKPLVITVFISIVFMLTITIISFIYYTYTQKNI